MTWSIRGLELPPLLVQLIEEGRWRHPGDEVLLREIPWFEDPLDFLTTRRGIEWESGSLDFFADEPSMAFFRDARGSTAPAPLELPWLDVEQAVLIAVCRNTGDDTVLALDYRPSTTDPRVVGTDFWTDPRVCTWRTVAPTFTAFATALGLTT